MPRHLRTPSKPHGLDHPDTAGSAHQDPSGQKLHHILGALRGEPAIPHRSRITRMPLPKSARDALTLMVSIEMLSIFGYESLWVYLCISQKTQKEALLNSSFLWDGLRLHQLMDDPICRLAPLRPPGTSWWPAKRMQDLKLSTRCKHLGMSCHQVDPKNG